MNEARIARQQSVQRAIDVLFCFGPEDRALSAAEVAQRLDMNRTTAWRYLQSLAGTGLVRELGEGRFGLGARTVSLAEAYTRQWGELEAVAGAALVRLRDRVGETAALHLRQGWARVVVRQVESRHELRRTYRDLGQPISLLTGSPSLAILAALSPHERAVFLDAHSDAGAADRRRIDDEVDRTIARGFAQTRASRVPDVASVAAPIRDSQGQVVGAVNVTGPVHRLPEERVAGVAAEVIAAASWIEARIADEPSDTVSQAPPDQHAPQP